MDNPSRRSTPFFPSPALPLIFPAHASIGVPGVTSPSISPLFTERPPVLLGAGGMLHRAWDHLLTNQNLPHRNLARKDLDLTHPDAVERALEALDTRLILNCSAYTNVDAAEQDEVTATLVNGTSVGRLAELCKSRDTLLVHYSTDYVFDGEGTSPYPTDHPRHPLNAYGRSKALGEQLIEQSACDHLILRTSWLYAPWGKNFVRTIAALVKQPAKHGKPLRIVNDQRGRPTSSEHLALASFNMINAGARGLHHLTDSGHCTWHDFACEIARLVNPATKIDPCSTAELARPAPRPAYSVLDLTKSEALIGPLPSWQSTLADVIGRLE